MIHSTIESADPMDHLKDLLKKLREAQSYWNLWEWRADNWRSMWRTRRDQVRQLKAQVDQLQQDWQEEHEKYEMSGVERLVAYNEGFEAGRAEVCGQDLKYRETAYNLGVHAGYRKAQEEIAVSKPESAEQIREKLNWPVLKRCENCDKSMFGTCAYHQMGGI